MNIFHIFYVHIQNYSTLLEAFGTAFMCIFCVYLQRVQIKTHMSGRLHGT